MLNPKGRVVMVSGANRGIGLAIAKALHERGYTLSLGARDQAALEKATSSFDTTRVLRCPYDAAKPATNEAWVKATVDKFGRIDGLVNNAGIAPMVRIEDADESKLDQLGATNVKAPLRMIRLTLPHLRKSGTGRVINVASLSGKRVKNENVGYAMSKFALVAMTHALRLVGWPDGVRATALCPGFVATDLTAGVTKVARHDMIDAGDLAELAATVIALPNNSVVAVVLVNCQFEEML